MTMTPGYTPPSDSGAFTELLSRMGLSPDDLRSIATQMELGQPTLRQAFEVIADRLPAYLRQDRAVSRLLDGEPPMRGAGGADLPGIDGLGDLPVGDLNERAPRHVGQVQARSGAFKIDNAIAHGRVPRTTNPRDVGHGAAQLSLSLIRRVAGEVEKRLHISMPEAKSLYVDFRQTDVHGFTEDEVASWPNLILHRRDPVLDRLVLAIGLATGARKSALLNLRLIDCDAAACRVWLPHKGSGKSRYWVPVHRSLLLQLWTVARQRGATSPNDYALLRLPGPDGTPRKLTTRYFDHLWSVLDSGHSPESFHTHRLRHTTNELIRRHCGSETAERFLDHQPEGGRRTNDRYTHEKQMPTALFLEILNAVFGPYDDFPLTEYWQEF